MRRRLRPHILQIVGIFIPTGVLIFASLSVWNPDKPAVSLILVLVFCPVSEAPAVVKQIQSADAAGKAQKLGQVVAPLAGCGENVRSLAGPFGYATSVQGCAVIGYPGYQREYHWYKESDVSICTHGKGFNSSNAATWYNTGCQDGNWLVPWGNTLAYTQMQGLSLSGATGAAYVWRA